MMKRTWLTLLIAVALAVSGGMAWAGPVILTGDDLEDHIGVTGVYYQGAFAANYAASTNAGTGILVLGGSGSLGTVFGGGALDLRTLIPGGAGSAPTTVVVGAAAIAAAVFDPSLYKMIYVPSDSADTAGGVTAAENTALAGRSADIAAWVNAGGGLWANTQGTINPSPWAFVGGLGGILTIDCGPGGCATDVTETATGIAAGLIAGGGDHSAWHTAFIDGTYEPVGLSELAFYDVSGSSAGFPGNAAIIGGLTVTIIPTPGPATLILLGLGLASLAAARRFARR